MRLPMSLLFLLLLALTTTFVARVASLAPSSSSVLNVARTAVPVIPQLHVVVVIMYATPTHMAASLEYALELVNRGHRVTWMHLAVYDHWLGTPEQRAQLPFRLVWLEVPGWNETEITGRIVPLISENFFKGIDLMSQEVHEVLYLPGYHLLEKILAEDKADVLLCGALSMPCVDLADKLALPFVVDVANALSTLSMTGPFDVPGGFSGFSHEWHQQSWWNRFWNTWLEFPRLAYHLMHLEPRINRLREKIGVTPVMRLYDKWFGHDVLFNSNFATDWATYLPPYIHMLGPHSKQADKYRDPSNIETGLRAWLDESLSLHIPVVYMALGSICILKPEQQAVLVDAFSTCTTTSQNATTAQQATLFRVVWVTNRPLNASVNNSLPASVHVEKWTAQVAVLAHLSVRLFISHCGSSSVQESIAVGLPTLALPCFGDQPLNAVMLADKGIALTLDKASMTSDEICDKMRSLTYEPQYQEAANRAQMIYHLSRDNHKRGADIIERAALAGVHHLLPYRERAEVPLYIRYNVDVYLIGVSIIGITFYAVFLVIRTGVIFIISRATGMSCKTKAE